jgi:tetratricopeptide (TPR) repeat protein
MAGLAWGYAALGRHTNALKLREEVLTVRRTRLGADNPDTLLSMYDLAHSYAALGRHADALKLRERTLTLRRARLGPDHPDTLRSMQDVADSLITLGRGAEAVPIIDECATRAANNVVARRLIPEVIDLRLRHFEKAKDVAGVRATAEMWERLNRTDANSLYNAACFRAVTAAILKVDPESAGAEATKLANEEADRAMAWLHKAVATGYKDAAHMAKDSDLNALRGREDFKKLLAELDGKKK